MAFLDKAGLERLWQHITSKVTSTVLNHIDTINYGGINLLDKKIIILGDSINYGAGWQGGFANLIAEEFPSAQVANLAISGSTLDNTTIFQQLKNHFQAGNTQADYVIIDGGGVDIFSNVPLGTIDADVYSAGGFGEEFDKRSILGAFEHLITNIQKFYPHAKIIYFNLFKLHPTATDVPYATQRATWEGLEQACEKYAVRYVDFYNKGNFTPHVTEQFDAFMYDWIHLNEAGYRHFWPLLREALMNV